MTNPKNIHRNLYNQFCHWLSKTDVVLLIALALMLPLHKYAVLIVIWLLLLSWLLQGDFKGKYHRFIELGGSKALVAFFGLIVLYVLGGLYSSDGSAVAFELEKKTSLVILPLLLFSMNRRYLTKKTLGWIFTGFVAGMLIGYSICIENGWSNYRDTGNIAYLYYERFSILHHPGYFALYTCFAIAVLVFNGITIWPGRNLMAQVFRWSLVFFFIAMLFLVASKAGILTLALLSISLIVCHVFVRRSYVVGLILLLSVSLMMSAGFFFMKGFATRFQAMEKIAASIESPSGKGATSGVQVRRWIWQISVEQILERPLLGTGTGDYKAETLKKIEENQLLDVFDGFRNAHNQFLQTTVTLGIWGGVMLLLWLFYPMVVAIRKGNALYVVFIIITAFNFLVESMLETQSGVLFVTFFHGLMFVVMMSKMSRFANEITVTNVDQ